MQRIAAIVLLVSFSGCTKQPFMPKGYEAIQFGMTYEQASQVIGGPLFKPSSLELRLGEVVYRKFPLTHVPAEISAEIKKQHEALSDRDFFVVATPSGDYSSVTLKFSSYSMKLAEVRFTVDRDSEAQTKSDFESLVKQSESKFGKATDFKSDGDSGCPISQRSTWLDCSRKTNYDVWRNSCDRKDKVTVTIQDASFFDACRDKTAAKSPSL